jgi:Helix-turn-helix.
MKEKNDLKNSILVERLTELTNRGITKSDMARWANITPQSVNGWFKKGVISKSSAIKVAEAAGVSVTWLLGEDVDQGNGLNDKQQKLIKAFNQLPPDDQDKFITMMNVRLKEIDDFIEQYKRMRLKDES